jgi:hypothetical protein
VSGELRPQRAGGPWAGYAVARHERWRSSANAQARDERERWNWPLLSVWVVAIALSLLIWAGLALVVFQAVA